MADQINRRDFLKQCATASAVAIAGSALSQSFLTADVRAGFEICAVTGDRYFDNTIKAVEALGGMKRFVSKDNIVGILINSGFDGRGAFTNPDVALAVVKMCREAGAKQIYTLNETSSRYWRRSTLYDKMKYEIGLIQYSGDKTEVKIERGKSLKEADVSKMLLSCNVFINVPIIKNHAGTRFTCNLKNMMGVSPYSTCRRIHFGDKFSLFRGYYDDVKQLAQGIADLNLVRQPNLCIVDATEILATNGPNGPGEIRKPNEVVAGTNCLATDMYCVQHLGVKPEDLLVIKYAQQHGIGPKSLAEVKILKL